MRKRLVVGLGVAAAVVLLGATAWAAWTQGEAVGERVERAKDKPRLNQEEVISLLTTAKPDLRRPSCAVAASYVGGGLWIVSTSRQDVPSLLQQYENEKAQYARILAGRATRLQDLAQATYGEERQRFLDIENQKAKQNNVVWGFGVLEEMADKVAKEAASKVVRLPDAPPPPPTPPITTCRTDTFAVSDRTGNVTGP